MKIALIDDDVKIRAFYKSLIGKHFPEYSLLLEADSAAAAITLIQAEQPDIVVLDIDLGDGTGFDVLQAVKPYRFSLIFSTAFNDFAIKAIKFSALDYILKPIDELEFCGAIEKAVSLQNQTGLEYQLKHFFTHFGKAGQPKKLVLKTATEINMVDVDDIMYCRSDNAYTTFHLLTGENVMVSKGMKEYEELLSTHHFFRPHTSFLVNLNQVKKLDKTDGGFLILKNGKEIPVSTRKKARLLQILEDL